MILTAADIEGLDYIADEAKVDHRAEYSGRAMYGRTCFAITGHEDALARFVMAIARAADIDDIKMIVERGSRSDNMGLDMVYYWPDLDTTALVRGPSWQPRM
jgi:hypothetical protein